VRLMLQMYKRIYRFRAYQARAHTHTLYIYITEMKVASVHPTLCDFALMVLQLVTHTHTHTHTHTQVASHIMRLCAGGAATSHSS
jgi:hypothetical protein